MLDCRSRKVFYWQRHKIWKNQEVFLPSAKFGMTDWILI